MGLVGAWWYYTEKLYMKLKNIEKKGREYIYIYISRPVIPTIYKIFSPLLQAKTLQESQ